MTAPENFVSRWARLKRNSAPRRTTEGVTDTALLSTSDVSEDSTEAAISQPQSEVATTDELFDPAGLPSIEAITIDTDIRGFLRRGVPAELARAALRQAWATDPAIRDFIGIAENQWDFNDPTAMPGFGPLTAGGDVTGLAALEQTGQACAVTTEDVRAGAISATRQVDEIDQARAREYSLLAALLSHSPDAQMIEHLGGLSGDTTPLGTAHGALSAAAARVNPEQIEREYFNLFVGLGRGEIFPYASYYLTGYLYGRPLARLRETLKQIGIERTEGQSEPEDHVAVLFEVMAGLASGQIIAPRGTDRNIFENHIKPWIGRFFSDLEHT